MRTPGFTLSELLVSLALLGVIATFTIPKVLQSQQDTKKKAMAKEFAAAISGAYQAYKKDNTVTTAFYPDELTRYLNYVQLMTSNEQVDGPVSVGAYTCNSTSPCVRMHDGGVGYFWHGAFGGTTDTESVTISFDPDATYSGGTTGPGKGVQFALYYNGRIATWGTIAPGTNGGTYNPCPSCDPTWFGWD